MIYGQKIEQLFIILLLCAFLPSLTIIGRSKPACAELFINEFMADNDSIIEDPDDPGSFADWIEIYNAGKSSVDMGGMYLTDNLANATQWRIPAGVTIPAGGYLLFWADNDEEQGPTHAGFKLAAEGEEIGLIKADGITVVDSVTFGAQMVDVSYGRYPDGDTTFGFMAATPDSSNTPHNAPPVITATMHAPVSPLEKDPVWVTCRVTDDNMVESVILTYNTGSGPKSITMYDERAHNDFSSGDSLFGAQIKSFGNNTIVEYYITATDTMSAKATDPVTAPEDTYYYVIGYIPPLLSINEFMADNNSTIVDHNEPDNFADWIEIYNAGESSVNMGGMHLTDNLANPVKWQIPAGVSIPAKGYLIFWADNDGELGPTHAGFKLAAEGEEIGLVGADGITLVDSVSFGAQMVDVSYGRYPDGDTTFGFMKATPGITNSLHNAPPSITGTTHVPALPTPGAPVWVTCTVTDDTIVAHVMLTYNTESGPKSIIMHDDGAHNDGSSNDGLFGTQIPSFVNNTIVDYYITATDTIGAQTTDPIAAPEDTYCYIVGYSPPLLFINEFMADNDNTIEDPDDPNNFEDWIEIYNAGESSLDMGGMYLTDNLGNPVKWQIPAGVSIPAKGYRIFWADNDEEQGMNHTGFKLDKDGGEIGLFDSTAKRNMRIDTITFDEQPPDNSCGRMYDGENPWVLSSKATPGDANAFPLGRSTIIWTLSDDSDSYSFMKTMGDCVSAINRLNKLSWKWETAYLFWGKPSGEIFSIEYGCSYEVSMVSRCSVSF